MKTNKGSAYHRGTDKEVTARKTTGRKCIYELPLRKLGKIVDEDITRQCGKSTGKNRFFCKEHFQMVNDCGMVAL